MPVWYEKTRALRESGRLQVVAVTLEQHPDRAQLYAQWKDYDFPILWDPFGLTGLEVVPVLTGVDEFGITRTQGLDLRAFDAQFIEGFMGAEFTDDAPRGAPGLACDLGLVPKARAAVEALLDPGLSRRGLAAPALDAQQAEVLDDACRALGAWAMGEGAPAEAHFFHGVARRLRYDSEAPRVDDFQAALDAWGTALRMRPNQYIWRRRIQQWGPRLDKPYAFYDWVEAAQQELAARGVTPVALRAPLSGSEVAGRGPADPAAKGAAEPDPTGALERDTDRHVRARVNGVPATGKARGAWRIHVDLVPAPGAEWTLDADPAVLWLKGPGRPPFRVEFGAPASKRARVTVDFGAALEPGETLSGYAVYGVCLDGTGACVFRRQDVEFQAR